MRKHFLLLFAMLMMAGCGAGKDDVSGDSELASSSLAASKQETHPRFNSRYLIESGDRAVAFFFKKIEQRNAQENVPYKIKLVDARDPRLYRRGQPIQPPTPATRAIVKVAPNGSWGLSGWLLETPQYLRVKYPNGGFVFSISYSLSYLGYKSTYGGLLASVSRNTSGAGWNYVHYIRGRGNYVMPAMFDQYVGSVISNVVWQL